MGVEPRGEFGSKALRCRPVHHVALALEFDVRALADVTQAHRSREGAWVRCTGVVDQVEGGTAVSVEYGCTATESGFLHQRKTTATRFAVSLQDATKPIVVGGDGKRTLLLGATQLRSGDAIQVVGRLQRYRVAGAYRGVRSQEQVWRLEGGDTFPLWILK